MRSARRGTFVAPAGGRRYAIACLVGLACCAAAPRARSDETLWDALNALPPAPTVKQGAAQDPTAPPVQPTDGSATETQGRRAKIPIGFLADAQKWLQRLGSVTKSDLKINGQHNLRYHVESVAGSRDSYENATYYGRRGVGGGYTDTDVTVTGKILGLVTFETRYTDNVYGNPYDNRLKLSYATKTFSLEAGDIQAGVTGNSLVDFTRSLSGVTLSANVAPGVKLSTLYSQEKAQTRTIVINGANRAGPYYVFAGQVVDGSARVRVNQRDMVLGQDYTMDPYTGELNFLNGLIVHELDTIAVTFETYGYNQSPGLLTGWRADVTALKPVRFGMTYLSQIANRSAAANRDKTEQFYGYNSATTPYVLELPVEVTLIRDEEGKVTGCVPVYPMTVTVGVLPQVYGTDYVLDPLLPNRVYFRMAIPSTQIIRIVYRPSASDASSGDRAILGFDLNTSLGKVGTITAEMASSSLSLSGESAASSAWQIRSDMKLARDKLRLNWSLKNIGADFTAIQSPGFRRNDRGVTVGADYEVSSRLKLNASMERTRRPAYSYGATGIGSGSGLAQTSGADDYSQLGLRANWQLGKGGMLSLNHNAMGTRMGLGGNSVHETDTLAFQQTLGQVSLDLSLGRQHASTTGRYSTTGSTGTQTATYGSDSLNTRLGAKWRVGERLSLDTILTNSTIKSADGKRNTAQDVSLNARAAPLRNLTVTVGYQLQNSGGYSLFNGYTDYTGGTGSSYAPSAITRQVGSVGYLGGGLNGYYGGGVNGGLGTYGNYSGGFATGGLGLGTASFGGNSRGLNIAANYQPWPTVTLDLNWSNGSSAGDYLFNSRRNSLSFSANYNPGERLSLVGGLLMQDVEYIGSEGGTATTGMYLNATSRPWGKLVANLNYNIMRSNTNAGTTTGGQTGGSTGGYYGGGYGGYFGSGGTNLASYGLRLEYPAIWSGNLFLQFDSADSTGYLASNQRTLGFGLAFDLGNNTQLQVGWRDQRYLTKGSGGSAEYSYHVRSLDADIGLRF
ncbi:MAG: hypothetical protein FJX72_09115 [Armatimonadetes bacterium]|nr:hypothetical protein [Armatimonadota bacterium]